MLIIFAGLSGCGKTAIAAELARRLGALYLRIDSIEQAIRDSGMSSKSVDDAGYSVGYAVAEDNLRLGRTVIADSVNPLQLTRNAWMDVAHRASVRGVEVEIVCSDRNVHRQRVETRSTNIPGLRLPTWAEVIARPYELWAREHIVIDTTIRTVTESVDKLLRALQK
ncbi:MAG: AAA family ATPase [Terriglobales bacterium]|jgi:predicted kinase